MAGKLIGIIASALSCRRGAAIIEYVLLAAFIATVAIVSLRAVGSGVTTKFSTVAAAL